MAKVLNPIFDYLVEQVVMDVLEEEPLGVSFIAAHGAETKVEVVNAAKLGLDDGDAVAMLVLPSAGRNQLTLVPKVKGLGTESAASKVFIHQWESWKSYKRILHCHRVSDGCTSQWVGTLSATVEGNRISVDFSWA